MFNLHIDTDIQVPYNWERILYFVASGDTQQVTDIMEKFYHSGSVAIPEAWMVKLRSVLSTASVSQEEMRQTIKETYQTHKYILEPHTAIGVHAYRKIDSTSSLGSRKYRGVVCLATATPAKFLETMQSELGFEPELPAAYKKLFGSPKYCKSMTKSDDWEQLLRQEIEQISTRRKTE